MSCPTMTVTPPLASKLPQIEIKPRLSHLCPGQQCQIMLKMFKPQQAQHIERLAEAQQAQQAQQSQQALNPQRQAALCRHLAEALLMAVHQLKEQRWAP